MPACSPFTIRRAPSRSASIGLCTNTCGASRTRTPIGWQIWLWTRAREVDRRTSTGSRREANLTVHGQSQAPGSRQRPRMIKTATTTCGREPLVDTIVRFLARERARDSREIRKCVECAIDECEPGAVDALSARLLVAGGDWTYYPPDPLARRIHHALAPRVLQPEPVVEGDHHFELVRGKPLVVFVNHLSYSDAHGVEGLA